MSSSTEVSVNGVFSGLFNINFDTPWIAESIPVLGGGGAVSGDIGTIPNYGVAVLRTPDSSGGGGIGGGGTALYKNGPLTENSTGWQLDAILQLGIAPLSPLCFRVGLCDIPTNDLPSITSSGINGVWMRFDSGIGDQQYTWESRLANLTGPSTSVTSMRNSIPFDSGYHHFRIRSIVPYTFLFSVDGGPETSMTNPPGPNSAATQTAMQPFFHLINRTGSRPNFVYVDFFSFVTSVVAPYTTAVASVPNPLGGTGATGPAAGINISRI